MSRLSVRVSTSATRKVLTERDKRMAITPTLPALLRSVISFAGLAAPCIIALLAR
jgi:hypothetical protein